MWQAKRLTTLWWPHDFSSGFPKKKGRVLIFDCPSRVPCVVCSTLASKLMIPCLFYAWNNTSKLNMSTLELISDAISSSGNVISTHFTSTLLFTDYTMHGILQPHFILFLFLWCQVPRIGVYKNSVTVCRDSMNLSKWKKSKYFRFSSSVRPPLFNPWA